MEHRERQLSYKHIIAIIVITAVIFLCIGLIFGIFLWPKNNKDIADSETTMVESEESTVAESTEDSEVPTPHMTDVVAPTNNCVILEIDGKTSVYNTLQSALDAAGINEATLYLNQNIDESVIIAEGQSITFDFTDYEHKGAITNKGTLTIISGAVGTLCNEGEDASITIIDGKIEMVGGYYENIILSGGIYGMEFNYHWVADGYVMKDNPYPDTKEEYPYMVDYDCACIIETDSGIKTYQTVCEAVKDTGNTPAIIELRRDHLEEEAIKIQENQNITLNCSYYTLTTMGITEAYGYFMFDGGTLVGEIMVYDGTTNIVSGNITRVDSRVITVYGGELLMIGGTINGWNGIVAEEEAKSVTISGGEINGYPTAISNACKNVSITGGKINGGIQEYRDYSVSIIGGLFSVEPEERQISGRFRLAYNTDEETKEAFPYTVAFKDIVSLEIEGEETTYYPTIQEAIDIAGDKKAVITLEADTDEDIVIGEDRNITFKAGRYMLNGEIIVNGTLHFDGGFIVSDEIAIRINNGTLIMDSGEINAGIAGIYSENGDITFNGGVINSNSVSVWANGTRFAMTEGEIKGESASILAINNSEISISDGKVKGKIILIDCLSKLSGGLYNEEPDGQLIEAGFEVINTGEEYSYRIAKKTN